MEPLSPGKGRSPKLGDHTDQRRLSTFGLPSLKASLAPAEVTVTQHSQQQSDNNLSLQDIHKDSPKSPSSIRDTIPRDYFHLNQDTMDLKSVSDTDLVENEHYKYNHQREGHSKIAEILQNNHTHNDHSSSLSVQASPFSSTESLQSLLDRQTKSKINYPNHQIYHHLTTSSHNRPKLPSRTRSNNSMFSIFGGGSKSTTNDSNNSSRNGNSPLVRSPLSEKRNPFNGLLSTSESSTETRKLEPITSNPHYIHSSPEVKESNHISLEYDPISKRKVLNSYEIIKEIGKGEHGKVKLARDIVKDELVAIKIVDRKGRQKLGNPSHLSGDSAEDKIRKEIAIMKKCRHPNVVQLKEVLDDQNSKKIYLVLEYLEKGEIKWKHDDDDGKPNLSLDISISALRDVVLGLEYLHYQGIIHRDIKPANLLISADCSVKISDFGVSFASSLNGDDQDELELCKSAGTPAFFAPELCITNFDDDNLERPKITHKIDVWALGVTFYALLFGKLPFWGGNEFELFDSINKDELKFPDTFPDTHDWTTEEIFHVKDLLCKMLNKDPTKRIGLKGIKRHPLTLRGLSVEEARLFSGDQKSCECKIHVSNEEVEVAVIGIASKLKKGFAKALKFAGLRSSSKRNSQSLVKTISNTSDHKPNTLGSRSLSYNLNDSSSSSSFSKSSSIAEVERRKKSYTASPLQNDVTFEKQPRSSTTTSSSQTSSTRHHKRVKSGETSGLATRATVEGDLFLNKSSAFSTLSGILDNDKRRSSVASTGRRSSTSDNNGPLVTSNGSSLDNGSQLVSLPVNASFGSLNSEDIDDYVNAQRVTLSSEDINDEQQDEENPRDFFTRMNSYSLNKATEKKNDDSVAPNEKSEHSATFNLSTTRDQDFIDDYNDGEADDEFDHVSNRMNSTATNGSSNGLTNSRRMDSVATNVSQYSVPSILASQLKASASQTHDYYNDLSKPEIVISNSSKSPTPVKRPPLIQRGSTPHYSFFGNDSSSESDSDSSEIIATRRSINPTFPPPRNVEIPLKEKKIIVPDDSDEESASGSETGDSDDEDDKELTLVLGSRRSSRVNSIAVGAMQSGKRPSSEPEPSSTANALPSRTTSNSNDLSDGDLLQLALKRTGSASVRGSVSTIERACSPLAKNAPKTPNSNANAHLHQISPPLSPTLSDKNPNEFKNHYNKQHIRSPIAKTHFFGGIPSLDEALDDRKRSNSVTISLLNQNK
ncbi:hypothetical protein BN7_2667 [Wickerhamomyces ciferrii]|uniref:non-specific serine/threonine protein kinase n=1 Tax=Wickerhamomyces ciferrii (strain ATCC 14091 / BCRC 22168 / CBS 111 / JCM 3599 / NBRC 0793 / NRRL Y-1031 F-60-10) TaxID=1206466 RepID=K0KDD3_WICCF|nr:uncharacterized protein BN7_2667 [Wickerhamomyces ciferrii]CCH43120.1 hypothetical protein BN7_2667 [Wickerhamomyces ciferrii]